MANILIADDSLVMRETLKTILTEAGHTIAAEAGNGYNACIEFDRHQPDLVTMDISMPLMSGLDALKSILSKHKNAKIIMVSSESCNSLICHALSLGAKDYVIKPFYIQSFVDAVNKVLNCDYALNKDMLQNIYGRINVL